MPLTRREVLRRASRLSVGLWLSDLPLPNYSALAQSTPRKLALLVGLNQYPHPPNRSPLKGCVTDVELYQELLVHRFGFHPSDILTLTEADATRSNIEAAFISHLAEQARPGDSVVFQFSGYGCLVRNKPVADSGSSSPLGEQQALVPFDAWIPAGGGAPPLLNGIYEDTLFLLLRSLPTDQVITLLDVGIQPSLNLRCKSIRERALPPWELEQFSAAELSLQERLLQQTQLTRDQVQVQRQSGQMPGLVLAAATGAQSAALELDRPEFSAGLFSYVLTQQLWANTPAPNITVQFGRLSNQMAQDIGPALQPTARGQKSLGALPWSMDALSVPQAVGLVISTNRNAQSAKIWLGGLPASLLEVYQLKSCFRVVTSSSLVQLRSRQGWTAIAEYLSGPPIRDGEFLEEAVRVLPKKLTLKLALGSDLSRIERVDATSAISMETSRIQVVGTTQPADYILTKMNRSVPPAAIQQTDTAGTLNRILEQPAADGYGLAYLGGALLPNTLGNRGEVVKLAIQRLLPTLETLLAAKLLTLTLNDTATTLRVSVTLEQVEEPPQPLIRLQTPGVPPPPPTEESVAPPIPKADKSSKILTIPNGTTIQYRLANWNEFPIYVWIVGFNSSTTVFASYTKEGDPKQALKALAVQPGTSVTLPTASQSWKASTTEGLNRVFVLCTRQPLTQTLAAQANLLKPTSAIAGFMPLAKPLPILQKLFEDLHQAHLATTLGIAEHRSWVLDTAAWASLQFIYYTV